MRLIRAKPVTLRHDQGRDTSMTLDEITRAVVLSGSFIRPIEA